MEASALKREIEVLRKEHERILRQLALLRDALDEHPAVSSLLALTSSLGRDLEVNIAHEQTILYEPMKKKSALKGGPIVTMLAEHAAIRRAFRVLASHMTRVRDNSSRQYEDLRFQIEGLQRLIGRHTRREEKILFWMAELEL